MQPIPLEAATLHGDEQRNADGSVDLLIGANAPAGLESNFMKTLGEDGWFVLPPTPG